MEKHVWRIRLGLLAACALILAAAGWSVWQFERIVAQGQSVLLELAPVDPRSLMQGDYMSLRYALESHLRPSDERPAPQGRYAYVRLDQQGRAAWAGVGDALMSSPADGVVSLRIRPGKWSARLGPNAFFFQEGTAEQYINARWGELKVAPDGRALLVALRGEKLELLGHNRF